MAAYRQASGLGVTRTKRRSDYGILGQGTVRRGAFARSGFQSGNVYYRLGKVGQAANQGFNAFQQGRAGAMFRAPETGLRGILSKSFTAFRPGAVVKGKAGFFRELAYKAGGRRIEASQRTGVIGALSRGLFSLTAAYRGPGRLGRVANIARQIRDYKGPMDYLEGRMGRASSLRKANRVRQQARQQRQQQQQRSQAQQQAQQQRAQAQQQRSQAQQQARQQRAQAQQQAQQQRAQAQQQAQQQRAQKDADKLKKQQQADKLKTGRELQTIGRQAIKSQGGKSVTQALREITAPPKPQKESRPPKQAPTPTVQTQPRTPRKTKKSIENKRFKRETEQQVSGTFRGTIGGTRRSKLGTQLSTVRKGFKTGTYTIDDVRKARENIKQGKSAIGVLRKDVAPVGAAPGKKEGKAQKTPKQPKQPKAQTPQQGPADTIVKGRDKQTRDTIKKQEEAQKAQEQVTLTTGKKVPKMTAKDIKQMPNLSKKEGSGFKPKINWKDPNERREYHQIWRRNNPEKVRASRARQKQKRQSKKKAVV